MKIALLGEFPSQPVSNFAQSIMRHCKYETEMYHRFANLSQIDADIIYYMNILDLLLHKEAWGQLPSSNKRYKICGSVLSYRIVQDKNIQKKLREMENFIEAVGFVNSELLSLIDFDKKKYLTRIAPDETRFKQSINVSTEGKLKLGYVGTFREDKRFNSILEPLIKKYEQIVEFKVVGKAGNIVPFSDMVLFYNTIDALLMASKYEGAPVPPLEAALCGRMSIVTECPIMKDIFNSESAILVGVSDNIPSTIAAFEDAIIELYEHRNDTVVKGQKAKEDVKEKANWKNIIEEYNRIFKECGNEEE